MDKLQGFAQQAQKGLDYLGQAGMSVAIVQNDEIIFSRGFGYRDLEQGLPVEEQTVFPIGSATKSLTAAGVMLLHQRGKLDLDAPIKTYMPDLEFQDELATNLASARDLLCHRTGLPRHDMLWVLRPYISRRELPGQIRHLAPSKPFRTEHQYNNLMYACLGRLIEVVDGRIWEQFVQEELFEPLAMQSACFTPDAAIASGNFSLAYERSRKNGALNPVPYSRLGGMSPAGAIHATMPDMANWVRLQLSRGVFRGNKLLEKERIEQMWRANMPVPASPFAVDESVSLGYALGWESEVFRGKTLVCHGGNVAGSSAMMAFMPEINAGVCIAVNTGTSMLTYATMYDAFDRLLGFADQKDWASELGGKLDALYEAIEKAYGAQSEGGTGPMTKRQGSEFAGKYRHPAYGVIEVVHEQAEQLSLRSTEYTMAMTNLRFDVFSAQLNLAYQSIPLTVSFQTALDGTICAMEISLEAAVQPIVFQRIK